MWAFGEIGPLNDMSVDTPSLPLKEVMGYVTRPSALPNQ